MIEALKDRLRRLRNQAGWKLEYMSSRLGYSRSSINSWEKGHRTPSEAALMDIAQVFGVSLQYIITGPEQPVPMLNADASDIGERMLTLRKAINMSERTAATRLATGRTSLREWESGESLVSAWRLPSIARLYGCSLDYLLTGRESAHAAALHRAIRVGASQQQLLSMLPPS
jgi:transcriptional regulator with XRE-family HTH domain